MKILKLTRFLDEPAGELNDSQQRRLLNLYKTFERNSDAKAAFGVKCALIMLGYDITEIGGYGIAEEEEQ